MVAVPECLPATSEMSERRVLKRGFGPPEDCTGVQKMMSNCPWATLAVTVVFF